LTDARKKKKKKRESNVADEDFPRKGGNGGIVCVVNPPLYKRGGAFLEKRERPSGPRESHV